MAERTENTETVIDLRALLGALLRRWWIIVLSALVAGAGTYGYTYYEVAPTYRASALMYVNNSSLSIGSTQVTISGGELGVAQRLVASYVVILQSRTMLNRVIEEAELSYSYETLRGMVSAESINGTEIFEVTVVSHSAREAEKIANTIADIMPDVISEIIAGSDVRIIDYAVVPARSIGPNYTNNAATGALVGALVGALIIVVLYLLDENIRSEDYLTQTYPDIPLLAVIPDMRSSAKQRAGEPQSSSRQAPSRAASSSGRASGGQRAASASSSSRRAQSAKKSAPAPSAERASADKSSSAGRKKTAQTASESSRRGQSTKKNASSSSQRDKSSGRTEQKKSAETRDGAQSAKKGQVIWDKKVREWKEID